MQEQQVPDVRHRIPRLSSVTYLDSAGAGLPPTSVSEAMRGFIDDWSKHGENWGKWLLDVVELRRVFGELIHANKEEVAVVPSVSVGLAALASSVNFSKRRKVVVSSLNFPTNILVWQRMKEAGLLRSVDVLKQDGGMVPIEVWEKAIDEETAVVSVDYVSWFSGYRERVREITELAHKRGALVVADGFHGLGVFPVDVKRDGVDALVGGFYKWLCGPHGAACLYLNESQLGDLSPAYIGWHGIRDNVVERVLANRDPFDVPFDTDRAEPSATAARFEWGTWAMVVVMGAIEAVKFALETKSDLRFDVIRRRRAELTSGLASLGVKMLTPDQGANSGGGIVTFEVKDHKAIVAKLTAMGIAVSGRYGHVRVSPHFYNTSDEVQTFLDALGPLIR